MNIFNLHKAKEVNMTGFSMLSVVLQLAVITTLITAVNSLIAPDLSPSQAIVKEGRYEKLVVGINYRMLSNSVSEVEYLEHIKVSGPSFVK